MAQKSPQRVTLLTPFTSKTSSEAKNVYSTFPVIRVPHNETYRHNLGYANEVGEAFRPLVHRHWVTASYGVATAYVLADTADKTMKAEKKEQAKANYRRSRVVATAADTIIWQTLASVVIPGFTINRICALTLYSLSKFTKLPGPTKKWTTTAVGLGSIPFIVKPIDTFVDFLLDKLLRPFLGD